MAYFLHPRAMKFELRQFPDRHDLLSRIRLSVPNLMYRHKSLIRPRTIMCRCANRIRRSPIRFDLRIKDCQADARPLCFVGTTLARQVWDGTGIRVADVQHRLY
jgi:hypothetical protein